MVKKRKDPEEMRAGSEEMRIDPEEIKTGSEESIIDVKEIKAGAEKMKTDAEKMKTDREEKLRERIEEIRGADLDAARAAADYVQSLAAPPGSLGKLTDAAVQLAGITGKVKNTLDRRRIIVMCADNGVVEEGVSSTPQIVTLAQALNMTRHLTGMSSLARHFGCEVEVVDIGIATPYQGKDSGILQCRIRRGTGNIANEPAMSREEAVAAVLGEQYERADTVDFSVWQKDEPNPYSEYFSGNSYLAAVGGEGAGLFNVTFEPRCRNNWHVHHRQTQVLICVAGRGWYQEWGKPAIEMTPGTVVAVPAEVKHWHGAARDSWFQHLTYHTNVGEGASNEWLEPVADEDYDKLK